jgi:protein-ribulosamine 3-kinase
MLDRSLYPPIEQGVSQHLGRPWQVRAATDMADYASHPSAILSDGAYAVFAKLDDAKGGAERLEIERAGLRLLAAQGGALTPAVVGIVSAAAGSILVLEAVHSVERTPQHWRDIGRALARLHRHKAQQFGLDAHTYFGPIRQDNTREGDWCTFYAERRLRPALRMAVDARKLTPEIVRQVEQVIARLPELGGPPVVPSLLHGDAQQNNFISTAMGTFMVDPAVYYGHPEMDMAYVDFFEPVPDHLFDGYRAELPIDPGFWDRRELWRLWVYLALVALDVPEYPDKLQQVIRNYI